MPDDLLDPVPTTHRKLTTVFSADVQGYSRLMEADEEGTLATLKEYRDAMSRLIASQGGRVVNTWGDGLIGEFPSVVGAVRAAVDVQNELAGRNETRAGEKRMHFRIGINLGDVIVDGDDIYGDGVNIAARLQSEAAPGGILISNTVYDQVRNKVAVGFDFLGELEVKNFDGRVRSYAIRIGEDSAARAPAAPENPAPARNTPSATRADAPPGKALADSLPFGRSATILGVIGAGLVAVNIASWNGTFWAAWPLLGFAIAGGLNWARTARPGERTLTILAVIGAGLIGINLLSWSGTFWARWPILGLAVAAGVFWASRRRKPRDAR